MLHRCYSKNFRHPELFLEHLRLLGSCFENLCIVNSAKSLSFLYLGWVAMTPFILQWFCRLFEILIRVATVGAFAWLTMWTTKLLQWVCENGGSFDLFDVLNHWNCSLDSGHTSQGPLSCIPYQGPQKSCRQVAQPWYSLTAHVQCEDIPSLHPPQLRHWQVSVCRDSKEAMASQAQSIPSLQCSRQQTGYQVQTRRFRPPDGVNVCLGDPTNFAGRGLSTQ